MPDPLTPHSPAQAIAHEYEVRTRGHRRWEAHTTPDRAVLVEAMQRTLDRCAPVVELRVCEIAHLMLRPGQLYYFTADPACAACQAYLASLA